MMTLTLACGLALGELQDPAGGGTPQAPPDLTELSLEELANLEVTTASRKAQRLADVPAAVTVIRGEDLRRMGVRSLEDALRMVPGANVARIDGNKWAVGIRGFGSRFSNKLQVLMDGRSVYTPLFSGVFWETQGTLLEDVERIEVVRGPGGATWGANAVNGVINVITKKASDTQGVHLHAGAGTEERAFGGARYGGTRDDVTYRVYAKAGLRDEQFEGHDDTTSGRGGFRLDWKAGADDVVTVSGEYYGGRPGVTGTVVIPTAPFSEVTTDPYDVSGGHLLARWDRRLGGSSSLSVQLSYTRSDYETSFFREIRDTLDLDASHRLQPFAGHDLVWGVGYRLTRDDTDGDFFITMDPEDRTDDVASVFLQDEIAIAGDAVKLVLGARAEHNDYTGFEVSPTARLAARLHERHLAWAAVSRAMRTPSRSNETIDATVGVIPPPLGPIPVRLVGNSDLDSEELVAYELGYRVTPVDRLSFDLALFLNDYDDVETSETAAAFPPVQTYGNKAEARTYGVELAATWQIADFWRLYGAYTFLRMNFEPDDDTTDTGVEGQERVDAQGQAFLRSSFDLGSTVSLDLMGRYVGALPGLGVERYYDADARIAWRPTRGLEISLVGQNLLQRNHFEHADSPINEAATEVERGGYLMLRWDF